MNKTVFKLEENLILPLIIVFWLILSTLYILHTPHYFRTHDFNPLVDYTKYILDHKSFPSPTYNYVTYHPPLYFLINFFVLLCFNGDNLLHIEVVRFLSVFYGAITISLIYGALSEIGLKKSAIILALLLTITTPAFIFVFTTYNNDSLLVLLTVSILVFSYSLYNTWSLSDAIALLITCICALYTKYTSLWCFLVIILFCIKDFILNKRFEVNRIKLISIFLIAFIFFTPWMILHNYHHTKKLFPTSFESKIIHKTNILESIKTVSGILNFSSEVLEKNLSSPWAYPGFHAAHPETKRDNYFSFAFVTSIIGEFIFTAPCVIFIWFIFIVHLLLGVFSLNEIFKSRISKFAIFIIATTYLIHILFCAKLYYPVYGSYIDFRYIAWCYFPWAILYSILLDKSKISRALCLAGIIVQIFIILTVKGTASL